MHAAVQWYSFGIAHERFFNLKFADAGVEVEQSDSIDDIQDLSLLDESLTQSERHVNQDAEHEVSK